MKTVFCQSNETQWEQTHIFVGGTLVGLTMQLLQQIIPRHFQVRQAATTITASSMVALDAFETGVTSTR